MKGAKKIPEKKARGIINLANWRDDKLKKLDVDINRLEIALNHLKERRSKIYRSYNDRQLSFKFGVTNTTIHRIVNGYCWKELER